MIISLNRKNNLKGENHLFVIIDNEIMKSSKDNGLDVDSIVKCDILYSISPKNILFKIGTIDIGDYIRFINSYSESIKEKIA